MIMPVITFLTFIALMIFFMIKVIPVFDNVYSQLGSDLPALTKFMVTCSNFFTNNLFISVSLFTILSLCLINIRRLYEKFFFIQKLGLRIPAIGTLIRKVIASTFIQTFSMLNERSVTATNALALCRGLSSNIEYQTTIGKALLHVRDGNPIYQGFQKSDTVIFDKEFIQMLSVGENTGQIVETLPILAEYYEGEVNEQITILEMQVKYAILFLLGGLVGTAMVALFQPLWEISTKI
jgi:type IV pilus assembly protein PilC